MRASEGGTDVDAVRAGGPHGVRVGLGLGLRLRLGLGLRLKVKVKVKVRVRVKVTVHLWVVSELREDALDEAVRPRGTACVCVRVRVLDPF